MAYEASRIPARKAPSLRRVGFHVFVAALVAVLATSCVADDSRAGYLEKAQNWTNTLSVAVAGLRIDDYQNAIYPKQEVMNNASRLEPYLQRLGSDIDKTTSPPGLEDIHRRMGILVADVIRYTVSLPQVLGGDGAPVYYLTPERRTDQFVLYPIEVENILIEHERLHERIRELKSVIAAELQGTTR